MPRMIPIFFTGFFLSLHSFAQLIEAPLPEFNKIRSSQHINIVLSQGDEEHLRIEYSGVDQNEINYKVKGKTLEIYLDGAKVTDKTVKIKEPNYTRTESYYKGAIITAYVTYKNITSLDIRGEGTTVCEDNLRARKFKLKIYGENTVALANLEAEKFKGKLYGENILNIKSGKVGKQKYNLYGENMIDTEHLEGSLAGITSFGENKLTINAEERINVFGMGRVDLVYSGKMLNRKLVIGESRIERAM